MYPALAVASKLPATAQALWVGSVGGMERELVEREGIEFRGIQGGAVVGVGLWRGGIGLAKLAWGTAQALGLIRRFRPGALLTTGGYAAIPMALAAKLTGVPVLVYLPDIEPGSAVKLIARLAAKVAVTAEESRAWFPNKKVVVTGYPVRPSLAGATRSQACQHFGLSEGRRTLLVFGGSRGARSINLALLEVLDDLLDETQVIHVSGELDWPAVKARRENLPADRQAHYHAFPYLHDEMGLALAAADLVVSRAGAGALGEFPIAGLGAILVPYPHAWRYQKVNADFLAARGAAIRLNDEDLKMKLLPTIRELLRDPARLAAMGAAARASAVPDAAERIAAELSALAGIRP
ncbi:MAG: UDP-N-acetylglucosamine--N-acetylmuramyl-(pentapeptide) pyrophosphoryl-undecaprenol N-acetylglucosamine transferase [Chloroflexota bacterium]